MFIETTVEHLGSIVRRQEVPRGSLYRYVDGNGFEYLCFGRIDDFYIAALAQWLVIAKYSGHFSTDCICMTPLKFAHSQKVTSIPLELSYRYLTIRTRKVYHICI